MPDPADVAPVASDSQPTPSPTPATEQELEALRSHNQKLIGEKRKVSEQLAELQARLQSIEAEQTTRKQQQLKDSGEFKTLWEQATETNKQLEARIQQLEQELQQRDTEVQTQLQRTQFLSKAANAVLAPDQLYRLVENELALNDGKLVARRNGIEMELDRYLDLLKAPGSGFEHFFRASGAVGMGAAAQPPTAAATSGNPYLSGNLTAVVALEAENPELARQLKAEAARARQA